MWTWLTTTVQLLCWGLPTPIHPKVIGHQKNRQIMMMVGHDDRSMPLFTLIGFMLVFAFLLLQSSYNHHHYYYFLLKSSFAVIDCQSGSWI
jgi:hypothetical protein